MKINLTIFTALALFCSFGLTQDNLLRMPGEKQRFELTPGYEVCSIYVNFLAADSENNLQAEVYYRKTIDNEWLQGNLVYDPVEKSLRGSLLDLEENTSYSVKLTVTDNNKQETFTADFHTKNINVPIQQVIVLDENTKFPLKITESGQADNYIRYTMKPGTILDGNSQADYAILLDQVDYIILDNLTIKGSKRHSIKVTNCTNIQIIGCDISDFGRIGTQRPDLDGKYYLQSKDRLRSINLDAGIQLQNCQDILIERNYIHDPRNTANSWFYAHPEGPNAVNIGNTRNTAIRYNDFIGSGAHRWNDAVEGLDNGSVTGAIWRDAEVKGNNFFFANDDGMEFDGGQVNARFFANKIEGVFCGVSTAPCLLGPAFYYRNLFCSTGTEFGLANVAGFKNVYRGRGRGRLFLFNNTIVGFGGGVSQFGGNVDSGDYLRLVTRKNLIAVSEVLFSSLLFTENTVDCDYDLLYSSADVNKVSNFQKIYQQQMHGIDEKPLFVNAEQGNYQLLPESPGFAEVGAFTNDYQDLPYRPIPVTVSAARLNFSSDSMIWQSQELIISVSDVDFVSSFQICKNSAFDFLDISPKIGQLSFANPVTLTVKINPDYIKQAKLHSSAFLIRLPNGFSRAITVYVDSSDSQSLLALDRKNIIKPQIFENLGDNKWRINFSLTHDFNGYLFARFTNEAPRQNGYFIHNQNEEIACEFRGAAEQRGKPVWKNIGYKSYPNKQLQLAAGEHSFIVSIKSGELLAAALGEKPEMFLNSPWQ